MELRMMGDFMPEETLQFMVDAGTFSIAIKADGAIFGCCNIVPLD